MSEEMRGTIDDFQVRFEALATEAEGYGVTAVWGLATRNDLSKSDDYFHGYSGSYFAAMGLAFLLPDFLHDASSAEFGLDE